jgi:hypothetical protein
MSMTELLGSVYGTAGHSDEDRDKRAQAEFFTNLCKQGGIQIEHLTDDQVKRLWKVAMEEMDKGEPEKKEDKKKEGEEEKSAAARREWQEKRAAAEKIAEADALGRIMAHAYVAELRKIAEEAEKKDKGEVPPQFLKEESKGDDKKEDKGEGEKKESQARAEHLLARLGKTAQASSTTSLDELAAEHAVELLKGAGMDAELARSRVGAVYTLGLGESTKIASAESFERAIVLRALEFCEAAGAPVDWSKA